MNPFRFRLFWVILLAGAQLVAACGSENGTSDTPPDGTDSLSVSGEAANPAELLPGKWLLKEMRITGMEPIVQQESYLIFDGEGKLTISNPSDPDLGDFVTDYYLEDRRLFYESIPYEIEILTVDTLILVNEVDNEKVNSIYIRVD